MLLLASVVSVAQTIAAEAAAEPEFDSYQLVLLKRPSSAPDASPERLAELQELHLEHLAKMAKAGRLVAAGPFGDQPDPSLRGLALYRLGSVEEARRWAEEDPAVRAGRLEVEVMTWYTQQGALAFPLTEAPGGLDDLLGHLERSRDLFLQAIAGLSPAQWDYKPAPERWSIAECVEHVAAAERFIREQVEAGVLNQPTAPELLEAAQGKDAVVLEAMGNRTQKFRSPEPLVPTGRYASPAEALAVFEQDRAVTLFLAQERSDELRSHAAEHPGFGALDGYGWLLFISTHSERHTQQILEVMADPGFPST